MPTRRGRRSWLRFSPKNVRRRKPSSGERSGACHWRAPFAFDGLHTAALDKSALIRLAGTSELNRLVWAGEVQRLGLVRPLPYRGSGGSVCWLVGGRARRG
ncbi:hypothetical protein MPL1032_30124 [Mesorhizobium plurifarium]|uniref:Uncharacterized protein n=1 Tax=Mesorhizobium plurifarium TaxID=69974 RepID=A0A0K2W3E2_MESPL|nr:hypothetical protein MPL1032_30124 [Mesorhizobium plurifarium]